MIKKGDKIIYYTIRDNKIMTGFGTIHKCWNHVINIIDEACEMGSHMNIERSNVFPYNQEKYEEMCNDIKYRNEIDIAQKRELSRLKQICNQDNLEE